MPTAFARGRAQRAPEPEGVDLSGQTSQRGLKQSFADEEQEFLFGPTLRPDEPVNKGATARRAPPPKNVNSWLPQLLRAAGEPGAPVELLNFIKRLRYHMGA